MTKTNLRAAFAVCFLALGAGWTVPALCLTAVALKFTYTYVFN